jgi:hypothetical protein
MKPRRRSGGSHVTSVTNARIWEKQLTRTLDERNGIHIRLGKGSDRNARKVTVYVGRKWRGRGGAYSEYFEAEFGISALRR